MSECHLKVHCEDQFTFVAESSVVRAVLHDLADDCKVKIQAMMELKLKKGCVLVKLVPERCSDDLRRVLRHHCVKYHHQDVLVVEFGKDVVRDLAWVSRRLCKCDVEICAFYFDRCGNGVYQVSSVSRAKKALGLCESKSSSSPCEKKRWFERHQKSCPKERSCHKERSCSKESSSESCSPKKCSTRKCRRGGKRDGWVGCEEWGPECDRRRDRCDRRVECEDLAGFEGRNLRVGCGQRGAIARRRQQVGTLQQAALQANAFAASGDWVAGRGGCAGTV